MPARVTSCTARIHPGGRKLGAESTLVPLMSNSDNNDQVTEALRETPPGISPLREALAALEHDQWREWSETVALSEQLSPTRAARWRERWIGYECLSEEDKDLDRAYADRVIALLARLGLLPEIEEGAER